MKNIIQILLSPDAVLGVQTNAVKYFCGLGYDPNFAEKKLNNPSWTGPTGCDQKLAYYVFVRTLSTLHHI